MGTIGNPKVAEKDKKFITRIFIFVNLDVVVHFLS